ncbi:hypothetical protein [Streptomyces subrutilus]|uniref:hypothetical protein n=1 Tax=Streptomyces subrutilus TaxID=36818 RepID=UPI00142F4252|nr:hypothetical protein [Streptomyces subrutilus]
MYSATPGQPHEQLTRRTAIADAEPIQGRIEGAAQVLILSSSTGTLGGLDGQT